MSKKSFKLNLSKKDDVVFDLSLMLLPAKIDYVTKKQNCKKNVFKAYNIANIKIIFILLTKIIILYI